MSRWSRWVGLLDRREPAVALAMYRIAIGSCLLYAVGTVWAGGLVEAIWMDIPYGGYRNVGNEAWLVELAGGASPEVVWPLVIGSVVAGLAIVLGVGGRLPALVALLAFQNLGRINGHCGGSYDPLMTNALWLLFLSDSTATFSVDAWRRGALWSGAQVPAWPRWLMMVQLVLLYASSGVHTGSLRWGRRCCGWPSGTATPAAARDGCAPPSTAWIGACSSRSSGCRCTSASSPSWRWGPSPGSR